MVKKIIVFSVILTIGGFLLLSFTVEKKSDNLSSYSSTTGLNLNYYTSNFDEVKEVEKPNTFVFSELGKSYIGFKEALAFKESRGDYGVVNPFGYLGKYQFSENTLILIGIKGNEEFLKNPELQEKAFYANLSRNKWILRKDIKRTVNKKINRVVVTESGILAAAHLVGPGAVKKYLRSGGVEQFADAYGTTIQNYMKRFSGYDTSSVVPLRKAKAL